ncbi:MAG: Epimerase family protein [Flavobacteriaceae bacterium]|nr:MAG: Epimerase family protein [Flavobacteriaceae bacterium]|tara:strand:+ start:6730 stop:7629 length:900 start_codon:yes stop_codon:yes gene_type:complete
MKNVVLITGASGNLAKSLGKKISKDYTVRYLTTNKLLAINSGYYYWDIEKEYIDKDSLIGCNHIIHLAGNSILNKWTKKNKKIIYDSRIKSANMIFDKCKSLNVKIETFISASAIGIYDEYSSLNNNETSLNGKGWLSEMTCDWEIAANKFKLLGSRVVQMRISLIFSNNSGFLKSNLQSMKYGIGLVLGNSKRKIHWIHIDDLVRFIEKSIKDKNYSGPYNIASDETMSQINLIKLIKKKLFPNSIIIKIPIYFVKLILGERSKIIYTDINISVNKLKEQGFNCNYNNFNKVLEEVRD